MSDEEIRERIDQGKVVEMPTAGRPSASVMRKRSAGGGPNRTRDSGP